MNEYMKLIHGYDIYHNFNFHKYKHRVNGWNVNPVLYEMLINQQKPKLIIELGSWIGASAISMAKIIKNLGLDTKIICIDTWLGSLDFIGLHDVDRERSLMSTYGYPDVYRQFLSNILYEKVSDIIIPFPNTFEHACGWLTSKNIKTELIYSDGHNAMDSVYNDLTYAWPLLSNNAVVFGDDLQNISWPGIKMGLNKFCINYDTKYGAVEGHENFWIIKKIYR